MTVNFTVEMETLKQHVNFVRGALGTSGKDLAAQLFRFRVEGNKAIIFVAEKEMFCRSEMPIIPADGAGTGVFAVLGEKMEALVAQVAAEKVIFNPDQENLEVQAGFLTVNFEMFDSTPLKAVETGIEELLTMEGVVVNRELLVEALTCAKACSTTDSLRPDVNHSELRKGRLLASDGRKMMIYSPNGVDETAFLKVPNSALSAVVSSLKHVDADSVQIIEGKSYFYLKGSGNRFALGVRKVERVFPGVEAQITNIKEIEDEISVDKNVLVSMCKGVSLGLSGDEVRVELVLRGTGREAYLEIEGANKLGRRSHERSSCGRKNTETVTIPLSFKHILDTLGVFKGDSVVDMVVVVKRNILLVRDKTQTREVLTVIPFRTSKAVEDEKKEAESKAKKVETTTAKPAEKPLEHTAVLE